MKRADAMREPASRRGRTGARMPGRVRPRTAKAGPGVGPGAWMVVAACVLGCREATSPFASLDRPTVEREGPLQLTFSALDERTPVWIGPDSLAYSAEGFAPFAEGPGVLMKIAATGGAAEALLPALQVPGGASHWLASPAPSPDQARAAYVELWSVADEMLCPATNVVCDPGGTAPTAPRLGEIRLHVMDRESGGSPVPQRSLAVPLDGREFVPLPGDPFLPGYFRIRHFPFQRLFHEENPPLFRPAWDPSGGRGRVQRRPAGAALGFRVVPSRCRGGHRRRSGARVVAEWRMDRVHEARAGRPDRRDLHALRSAGSRL